MGWTPAPDPRAEARRSNGYLNVPAKPRPVHANVGRQGATPAFRRGDTRPAGAGWSSPWGAGREAGREGTLAVPVREPARQTNGDCQSRPRGSGLPGLHRLGMSVVMMGRAFFIMLSAMASTHCSVEPSDVPLAVALPPQPRQAVATHVHTSNGPLSFVAESLRRVTGKSPDQRQIPTRLPAG